MSASLSGESYVVVCWCEDCIWVVRFQMTVSDYGLGSAITLFTFLDNICKQKKLGYFICEEELLDSVYKHWAIFVSNWLKYHFVTYSHLGKLTIGKLKYKKIVFSIFYYINVIIVCIMFYLFNFFELNNNVSYPNFTYTCGLKP